MNSAAPSPSERRPPLVCQQVSEIPFVTVDAPTSRDLDDAIHVAPDAEHGGWVLHVAIAAPALHVAVDSAVDRQARAIAATIYAGVGVRQSMLPLELSEQACSLQAGRTCTALQMRIHVAADGGAAVHDLSLVRIVVAQRLCYEDIPRLARLAQDHPDEEGPRLARSAIDMSEVLYEARRRGGALVFRDAQRLIYLDEEGSVRQASSVQDMAGHLVVEECMILANRLLARWALERDVPFLYRNHRQRLAAPAAQALAEQILVDAADGGRPFEEIDARLHLLMGAAQYGASADGHYALNLPQYAHSTSSLRRYADLVNQRQLIQALTQGEPVYSQEALVSVAEGINAALAQVKAERSEAMKTAVRERAVRAIARGQLERLGAPEIVQALKLAARGGQFDEQFSEFMEERLQAGVLEDKVHAGVVEAAMLAGARGLPQPILQGWSELFARQPERAKGMIMFAVQSGLASDFAVRDEDAAGGFRVWVRLKRVHDAVELTGCAWALRKKDASNTACARLVCALVGAADPAPGADASKAGVTAPAAPDRPASASAGAGANHKGALLEHCQKAKWSAPVFEVVASGPPHAAVFVASVTVRPRGSSAWAVQGEGCATRKAAEAAAAQVALERLVGG